MKEVSEKSAGSSPALTAKEVLRWASSSIKKQSLHHSQVMRNVETASHPIKRLHRWGFESSPDYKTTKNFDLDPVLEGTVTN